MEIKENPETGHWIISNGEQSMELTMMEMMKLFDLLLIETRLVG